MMVAHCTLRCCLAQPLSLSLSLSIPFSSLSFKQYRNRLGEQEYRVAISSLCAREYGETVGAECVLATVGVSGAVVSTLLLLRARHPEKRLRVGLMEPFYTYHQFQIERTLGENKQVSQGCNFLIFLL